jgi:hypothetical protein
MIFFACPGNGGVYPQIKSWPPPHAFHSIHYCSIVLKFSVLNNPYIWIHSHCSFLLVFRRIMTDSVQTYLDCSVSVVTRLLGEKPLNLSIPDWDKHFSLLQTAQTSSESLSGPNKWVKKPFFSVDKSGRGVKLTTYFRTEVKIHGAISQIPHAPSLRAQGHLTYVRTRIMFRKVAGYRNTWFIVH